MDMTMSKNEIRKTIAVFSGPIIAELMLMSMISMVNLSMVGHLGAVALSAVGLTNQPVMISLAVFQSFNIGATALVARFIGAKEGDNAKKVVIQTMMVSVILGLALAVLGIIFSRELVLFMGALKETVEPATLYMKYMSIGMFFQAIPTAVTSLLRGAGESKIPMKYNVVSNIVNAGAGFILIYGINGFWSGMGLNGAAIATTLAKAVACAMSIHALYTVKLPIALKHTDKFRFDLKILRRILDIGISAAVEQFTMRITFLLYTRILSSLGTNSFAAHQVISNVTQFVSNIVNGFSVAASSYTGRYLGAKRSDLAETYVREINKMGLVISLTLGSSFFWAGKYIARVYTSDIEVILLCAAVLKVATFIVFPQNYLSIAAGCLRGAGDTKWPLYTSIVGMFSRLGLAWLFVHLGYGLVGAWCAAVCDQSVRAVLVYYRFKSGKWKEVVV